MTNPWQIMTQHDGAAMDDRKETGPARFQVALKRELIWRAIQSHLPKERTTAILDLGGGTGVWAVRLAQEGYRVLLTDISPGLLAQARKRVQALDLAELVQIEEADVCDLSPYAEAAFPLVLALGDPLSYCNDARRALQEVRRVAATDGALIADVENRYRAALSKRRAATWADARRILSEGVARWPDPSNPAPMRQFTPSELRELLVETGWQVQAMYPSDLLASVVSEEMLQDGLSTSSGFQDAIAMETQLREDESLLGSGSELQFVALKDSPESTPPQRAT